jgi:integrase
LTNDATSYDGGAAIGSIRRDISNDRDLVFPTEIGTPTLYGNLDRRHFKEIIERTNEAIRVENEEIGSGRLGPPVIRLYDLRHTMATLLISKGVNPKVVSERLGHSSISLTLDTYSHVLPAVQQDATEHMEKLMFGK